MMERLSWNLHDCAACNKQTKHYYAVTSTFYVGKSIVELFKITHLSVMMIFFY